MVTAAGVLAAELDELAADAPEAEVLEADRVPVVVVAAAVAGSLADAVCFATAAWAAERFADRASATSTEDDALVVRPPEPDAPIR